MPRRKQPVSYLPIYRVALVRDGDHPADLRAVSCPHDSARLISQYLAHADREHLVVVLLDARHQIIGINTAAVGTLTEAAIHPREVFKPAILCNAAAIIVGHNHVSGCPDPSHADLKIAGTLGEAGKLLGIALVDFLIVTNGAYYSLQERGVL